MYVRVEFDEPIFGNDLERVLKEAAKEVRLTTTTKEEYTRVFLLEEGVYKDSYSGTNMRLWRGLIPMAYIPNFNRLRNERNFIITTGALPFSFASNDLVERYLAAVHKNLDKIRKAKEALTEKVT